MMKYILGITGLLVALVSLNGCGSSKKVEKSPIKTYVMPCSECISGDGKLRAWASGTSDNETTARKKAQTAAAAELAAMLSRTIESTTEDYTSVLSEGISVESKSFLSDKTKVVVKETLTGATIVCDRWTKDESSGQYTNYIVLELKGDDYLERLYDELAKNGNVSIDKDLLKDLFLKNIDGEAK